MQGDRADPGAAASGGSLQPRDPRASTASDRLARAAAATDWSALPEPLRRQAADLFLDTLAVIAAGSVHPSYAPFITRLAAEPGACTVLGRDAGQGVGATTAALLNGGATTVLQWQDGHRLARGHPASHLVPALLALAETSANASTGSPADPRAASAEAVMSAFVAGYEVGTRIGIALGGLQALLHDGGTWATLGTAAACAKLLGADAAGIAQALEGAASVAPMPYRETVSHGATAHHLYIGLGAATAITAAQSACAGLGAIPGTIEAFFGPRAGVAFDARLLCDGIGDDDRWSRHELHGAYFKWHPVCAHFSGLADALQIAIAGSTRRLGRPPTHDDVVAIDVALYATALGYDAPAPRNDLAARFSARAIAWAAFDPGGLQGDALERACRDPAAQAWLGRVRVAHDPALDAGYPGGRPARVRLQFADGTTEEAAVTDVRGDVAQPLPAADRAAKVRRALARRYGEAGAERVRRAFDAWLGGAPLAALTQALRSR